MMGCGLNFNPNLMKEDILFTFFLSILDRRWLIGQKPVRVSASKLGIPRSCRHDLVCFQVDYDGFIVGLPGAIVLHLGEINNYLLRICGYF